MKIMFDSNAFDHMTTEHLEEIKNSVSNGIEYLLTTIQLEEINNIPEKENRFSKLLLLAILDMKVVPISCFVLGHARLNYARLGNGKYYEKLLTPTRNNVNDAIIGDTALYEDSILVSDDRRFKNKMNNVKPDSCMNYDDFLVMISTN